MGKQTFDRIRKTVAILLAVCFLVSLTAASASAWYDKNGKVISAPEKAKAKSAPTPKKVTAPSAPTPEIATAPGVLGGYGGFGDCGRFGDCDRFSGCGCGRCCDEKKIAVITAVRAALAKGDGCFDHPLW